MGRENMEGIPMSAHHAPILTKYYCAGSFICILISFYQVTLYVTYLKINHKTDRKITYLSRNFFNLKFLCKIQNMDLHYLFKTYDL
jgi:hypothetical protein